MSGFSAEWLALREPVDAAARLVADGVTRTVTDGLVSGRVVRVVDLGCGTGSNVRFLRPRIDVPVQWRLLDHDERLLAEAARLLDGTVATRVVDLRALTPDDLGAADLVTASALLDLVSDAWLERFVGLCRSLGASVLMALNYDGRVTCAPADADDALVVGLVNRHQRTDKGFGPALGPDAGARVAARLADAGYSVVSAKSDWIIGADRAELQRQLIQGWAGAALEVEPDAGARIDAWKTRRLQYVDSGTSHLVVGHDDVGGTLGHRESSIANR